MKRRNTAELSATLDRFNICFSPINRPEDLFDDPHVLRPGGLVNNTNANGEAFPRACASDRVEWHEHRRRAQSAGARRRYSALRSELEAQEFSQTGKTAVRLA
jgi:Predicted acyl-CoA transferases/carnitine dehydratase